MSDIHFMDYDAQKIAENAIAKFEAVLGVSLGDADERRIMLNTYLLDVISLYASIDTAGRQNLLAYATGADLDAKGDTRGVTRLAATASTTTLRFTLSAAQSVNVVIPAGVRATPDGEIYWATDATLSIPAGALYGDAAATCSETGELTNGYAVGAIATLTDPLPYVTSVGNIAATAGGADAETDDVYRERIRESKAIYSTAGSAEAYSYYARTASALVQDVAVASPSAGNVAITVLAAAAGRNSDGTTAQAVLDAVLKTCSAETVRPLTDNVSAQSAAPVTYNATIKYYVTAATESQVVSAIEGAGGALEAYYAWQSAVMGRSINPDKLRWYLIQAGAQWAEVTAPALTQLSAGQYAALGTATISHEVIAQ